jgi:hypothetical protein
MQELAEVAHRQHAVREDARVAGVLRELVVDVHGVRIAGRRPVGLERVLRDRGLREGRQLGAHRDGFPIERHRHTLFEMSTLRE